MQEMGATAAVAAAAVVAAIPAAAVGLAEVQLISLCGVPATIAWDYSA